MRILYSHYLTSESHPAVQMVHNISHELRQLGHEVQVHASAGLASANSSGDTGRPSLAKRLKHFAKAQVWFAKAVARNKEREPNDRQAIKRYAPDLVLARQDAYCWSVVKAASELGVPIVTYADAPVAYESRAFNDTRRWHPPCLLEQIEKWGLQQSAAAVTVSYPAARQLKRYQLETPIHVVPNGIFPDRFPPRTTRERVEIKRSLSIQAGVVIGFLGTFKSFHGIDRLQELMLWSRRFPGTTWVLIGDGPERGRVKSAVDGKVKALFLGRQKPEAVPRLLSACDIAVAPHMQLGHEFYFCPLKILEYAASGAATLASAQGDIPLLLGKGGEIVERDDLGAWTESLRKLIENPAHRIALGIRAREHVLKQFTWRHTARKVESVLLKAMPSSPQPLQPQPAAEQLVTT